MDLEFLERCFFGKKLQSRDQIIFKIYAKELFELIDSKVKRKKRAKSLLKISKKQVQNRVSKDTKSRSKTPLVIEINRQAATMDAG
jgi:hypothetical protein